MTKAIKATRKLSNFNFDFEGAAVALVGPAVGGSANGHTTLLTKSLEGITEEQVDKATEVQVTMNIVDFLCKFYHLWYEDAIVLATAFGYDVGDAGYSFDESASEYDEYIQEKVDAIQVMKSLVLDKEIDDIKKAVAELSAEDYLLILKAQEQFEKNFEAATLKVEAIKKSSGIPAKGVSVSEDTKSPSVEIQKQEEDSMSEFITKAAHEEAVSKAIEVALAPVQEELKKAKEQLEVVELAKLEAVAKARKAAIAEVEKDEAAAEALYKSLEAVSDESFEVIVKSLKAKEEKLEDSDLFKQKSKNTEVEEPVAENATSAILKAKYQNQ